MSQSRTVRLTPSILATSALLAWGIVPGAASGVPGRVRDALRNDLLSRADYERVERGYYEKLTGAAAAPRRPDAAVNANAALPGHGEPVKVGHGRLTVEVADVREFVLRPNLVYDPGRRIPWSTNSWGMRDRAYAEAKPPGTVRVALVGDSIGAGWGVDDHAGFEPRLEKTWDGRSRAAGGPAVEVLNFSVPGHGPGQRWTQFSTEGWRFAPDSVVFEATLADAGWDERRLRAALARGLGFDAPVYQSVLEHAKVPRGLDAEAYKARLKPLRMELLAGVYRQAVAECRSRGVPVFWALIPRVGKPLDQDERRELTDLAREAGFDALVDASGAFDGTDPRELAVGPSDYHPNAEGHRRIAAALDAALSHRVVPSRPEPRAGAITR